MPEEAERAWETLYRWEWFRRAQWRPRFRGLKAGTSGGSCAAFTRIFHDLGGKLALDSSSGLGLKTIILKEMGVEVVGCDGCSFAVEKALELARLEGCDVEYFTSRWAELPGRTGLRFDGIFNDALSWIVTREEFEASLEGFLGVLQPGGVLVFMGAAKGSTSDPQSRQAFFESFWRSRPRFSIEWTHEEGGTRCTSVQVREKGDLFVDAHHLFLIEERDALRLETATIREPAYWSWAVLEEMFAKVGFARLDTRTFPGMARGGADLSLNIAAKPSK
jgi:SAM-dependent methyltransferase